jgi:uncharacterized membrane protein YgcG
MLRPCAIASCFALLLLSAAARGEERDRHPLPIHRVVLFTSGVAFIEHRGEVEGDKTIDFKFHVDDVNDLLKSMVVQDEGGGHAINVTYAPQEPLSVQLGDLRIDPSRVRSLGDLLAQLRGEKIEVELTPNLVTGTIIAVDRRKQQLGENQTIEQEMLLLKTEKGLRNVSLSSVASVKLLNEALDRDLQKALELLASASDNAKKQVSIRLQGEGKRMVRVGYVQEFPVWKTSYRLVLNDKKETLLQGWAIVENTTDHDWTDVQVSLVSGRRVSFVMDLYQPMFLERPSVVPQLFAGLRPRVHQQDLAAAEEAFRGRGAGGAAQGGFAGGGLGGGGFGGGGGFFGGSGGERPAVTSVIPSIDPKDTVQVAAQGAQVGSFFRYAIEKPVTLASQKSAMLPIVNDDIKTERKAVFHKATNDKHPLSGLELNNSTKLHWMQGPITLFDADEYAGDAQIEDMAPATKRLITYALDLNIEVVGADPDVEDEMVNAIKIGDGYVSATKKQKRKRAFTVKNSNADAREVLVEVEVDSGWKLISPKPAEQTRDVLRFSVNAKPGTPAKLEIIEEQTVSETVQMVVIDPFGKNTSSQFDREKAFRLVLTAKTLSPAIKVAVEQWREKQQAVAATEAKLTQKSNRIDEIGREQARIRPTLAQLREESDLHRRYVTALTEQEDELKKLNADRTEFAEKLLAQQSELQRFLTELKVE